MAVSITISTDTTHDYTISIVVAMLAATGKRYAFV